MIRLLVIDDDVEFCNILTDSLESEGFEVASAYDGEEGLQRALSGDTRFDLIVLDLMLPGKNGFEVLQTLRLLQDTPVLMVSGRGQEIDCIVGLELGADDFMTKPCRPREIVARARAILRRTKARSVSGFPVPASERIALGDIELDAGTRVVRRNGEMLELTSAEFNFLEALLRAAGHVVTREKLAEKILGRPLMPYDRSLDVHASNLRKKLGHKCDGIDRIKTVRGVGYIYAIPLPQVRAAAGL